MISNVLPVAATKVKAPSRPQGGRLVVLPSEPIFVTERSGTACVIKNYYNPEGMFSEVFAWCPGEPADRQDYGMTILSGNRRSYARLLRDLQPNVVRAYGGFWASDVACRYRLAGVPVVVSVHDPHPSMVHHSVQYADLIICISQAVERAVLAKGAARQRIRHLPNRVEFLRSVQERLKPKRWLIRVPLYERDWRVPLMAELGVDYRLDPTHFTEYTQESFAEAFLSFFCLLELIKARIVVAIQESLFNTIKVWLRKESPS